MRLSQSSQDYGSTLLKIGDGTFPNENDNVKLEDFANLINTREELINLVWPDINQLSKKPLNYVSERAILAPLNSIVDEINETIMDNVKTEVRFG